MVYVKQDKSSQLPLCEIKLNLDKLGDQLFTGICTLPLQQGKSKENKSKVDTDIILFVSIFSGYEIGDENLLYRITCLKDLTTISVKKHIRASY